MDVTEQLNLVFVSRLPNTMEIDLLQIILDSLAIPVIINKI